MDFAPLTPPGELADIGGIAASPMPASRATARLTSQPLA
jgi:hypothetical protein